LSELIVYRKVTFAEASESGKQSMSVRKNKIMIRICNLHEHKEDNDLKKTSPSERIGMMWQLALDAWAFKGEKVAEPRLQRHIVSIQRS
jgi:hypothetical protein